MADILSVERRRELRKLAASVESVEDVHRIIEEQGLHSDPGENTSVFYYGAGVEGAQALSSREGFVRLEQTERGYFLDQCTRVLGEDGVIPRGSAQNTTLFGDKTPENLGEWGEASKDLAARTKGAPVVFPDVNRPAEKFKETAFFNAELPTLSSNKNVHGLSSLGYDTTQSLTEQSFGSTGSFSAIRAPFENDKAYGLSESQLVMVRVGGDTAANLLHALGADFGAVQAPSQTPVFSGSQTPGSVRQTATPSRAQSATRDPTLSHGRLRR